MKRRDFIEQLTGILGILTAVTFFPSLISCNEKKKKTLTVNQDKCLGCGKCISVCKHEAISIQNKKAVIDSEICWGCGECSKQCKQKAIS